MFGLLALSSLLNKQYDWIYFLFNTLTTDYEYSCSNGENLPLPIQKQLSEKLNLDHFEKKWAS